MCEIYVEGIVLKPGLCLVVEIKGLRRYNFWTENSDEIMEWAHELRRAKELYFKYMEAIPIQKQFLQHKSHTFADLLFLVVWLPKRNKQN